MTTFLGLDKEGWEIINAVATCLGVIATFTAVLVSLWLASRPDRLNLTGRAGIRVLLTPGEPGRPELLMMEIVNRGRRPAKITGIGWEFGARRSRRKHFVQQIDRHDRMSSALPIILDDGAEARWYHPFAPWASRVDMFATGQEHANFEHLYFVFQTSIGGKYRFKVEPALSRRLQSIWATSRSVPPQNETGRPEHP